MQKRKTYWFVEPLNITTNQVIADEMATSSYLIIPQHGVLLERTGAPPFYEDVWEVEHRFINKLRRNKQDLNLAFRVYKRQGETGSATLWKFEDPQYTKLKRNNKFK